MKVLAARRVYVLVVKFGFIVCVVTRNFKYSVFDYKGTAIEEGNCSFVHQ